MNGLIFESKCLSLDEEDMETITRILELRLEEIAKREAPKEEQEYYKYLLKQITYLRNRVYEKV